MIHGLIAAVFVALVVLFNAPWAVCFYPAFFYLGREHAQAEYRYIEEYCGRKRANMPTFAGFYAKAWNIKSM